MKHINYKESALEEVQVEGAKGAKIRWLIGEKDGAPHFAKRMFEIEVGGHTPYHFHDFEHLVFVLDGLGELVTENGKTQMNPWDAIYVDPGMKHNFVNIGDKPLIFLCSIPHEVKKEVKKNPFATGKANNC